MRGDLVTVLMPVYNGGPFLRAAVLSVTGQDYPHLDILVINDGSTDGSEAVLRELAGQDSRIRLISRENRGLVATLNEGVALARGRMIARMDADDVAYPDRISRQVEVIERRPEVGLVGMAVDYLYGRDQIFDGRFGELDQREIKIRMLFYPFFFHPAVMLNAMVLSPEELRYDEAYIHSEDFDLFRRIGRNHEVSYINRAGLAWRQGHNSVSRRHIRQQSRMHLQIVGEELFAHGIIAQPERLNEAVDGWAADRGARQDELVRLLHAIHNFDGFRGDDREAYRRAFKTLLIPLLARMALIDGMRHAVATLAAAGFAEDLTRRAKLTGQLGLVLGDERAENAMRFVSLLTRRFRSQSMRRQRKLPDSVLEALP